MSYILDALSKSERERRVGQMPDIATAASEAMQRPGIGRAATMAAVLALNLAALGGLYWVMLGQRLPPPGKPPAAVATQAPVATASAPAAPITPSRARPSAPAEADASIRPTTPAPRVAEPPPAGKAAASGPDQESQSLAPAHHPVAPALTQPAAGPSSRQTQIENVDPTPWLVELSAAARQSLPALRINAYYYAADPQRRFVLIDMVKYREGQRVAGGPLLERIGRDSLYLDAAGLRFRVPRP